MVTATHSSRRALGAALETARGISVDEAVARASRNVEALRLPCEADMDDQLARMGACLEMAGPSPSPSLIEELYRLAHRIVGFAGLYGYEGMAVAATSLCDVLLPLQQPGAWRKAYVMVHYDALRLLRQPAQLLAGEQARLLAGLKAVRDHA